jgi:membrane-associated phospholipid phosphatase
LLQAAEYDAVVSITHGAAPYGTVVPAPDGARPDAAADQAAHDVLAALYPGQRADLDAQLRDELVGIPDGQARAMASRSAATRSRSSRGATVTARRHRRPVRRRHRAGRLPADTPETGRPMYTGWVQSRRSCSPARSSSVRPPRPRSTAPRTRRRSTRCAPSAATPAPSARRTRRWRKFWSSAPVWNTWNQIAQQVATDRHTGLAETTAAFAAMDLALADTTIAMYDAKYADHVWRPVTAIQAGEAGWTPLTPTAADPSYPGAHSALSAAAATALTAFFGPQQGVSVTSAADPGVTRTFTGFTAVADEAGLSRIWAGQHTRLDHEAGRQLGDQVGGAVLDALQVNRAG